ncbi:hypothetical protein [Salarchaeum sp. JOR-1]|uniref:hypothetical protein n=1 Tax=Salarchaeum sp. JOR-1 TaxID=2599399 RepID=UPI001198B873|nr:hypothetical protein [Salarchaeum sp. JOR-1]QDX40960.1 hypothetical protein FQU85_08635 [Salarchaeum sp. JOR-1]
MPDSVPDELLAYLRESLGANFHGVAHYDRETVTTQLSPDVSGSLGEETLADIADDLRLMDVGRTAQESLYSLGSLYCTIRAFDDALLRHFIQGDERGTLVSLEPETAPGLTDFIYDVLHILHEHSAQEISRAPHWRAE